VIWIVAVVSLMLAVYLLPAAMIAAGLVRGYRDRRSWTRTLSEIRALDEVPSQSDSKGHLTP
jgi:hypothetical protein